MGQKYLIGEESFKTKEEAFEYCMKNNFSTSDIRLETKKKLCYRCLSELEESKVQGVKLWCPKCKRSINKIRKGVYQ